MGWLLGLGTQIRGVLGGISPAAWRVIAGAVGVALVFFIGYGFGARYTAARINGAVTEAIIDRAADDAAAAIDVSGEIRENEAEREETVREVIREVPVLIRDSRECDLPADVMRRLNEVAR